MNRRTIIIFICLLVSAVLAGVVWYQVRLGAHSRNTVPETLSISKGMSTAAILTTLEDKRLIASVSAVKLYLYRHSELKLQAGEYRIDPNTSTRQLISQLASGKTVSQEITILFREGMTVKEMGAQLNKDGYFSDGSFGKLARTPIKDLPARITAPSFFKLVPPSATLEGYLFPDTYRVFKNFTAEDLITKMVDNFERKLTPELRDGIAASGSSFNETIILASILQKEVRTTEEMGLASGVFQNRLKVGQALQSCATLAYILGVNKPQYSYEDTQIDSPYNTYKHPGLPPGPVSNPGLAAINATIHPTPSDYVYFLARPDTGATVFSKTLDEHNAAKAKYLK